MTHYLRSITAVSGLIALAVCAPAQAQTPEIDALRARAEVGVAEAQLDLGFMYANGRGVPQDDVTAHMWFNLAESNAPGVHQNQAIQYRDIMADRLNADQLAEAQRLAREWDDAHPRD